MKKHSPLKTVSETDTTPFAKVFALKKGILEPAADLAQDAKMLARPFKSDAELATLVAENRVMLFGDRIVGLSGRMKNSAFPWFAMLLDFTSAKPQCFLVTVMLSNAPVPVFLKTILEVFAYMEQPSNREIMMSAIRTALKAKSIARAFEPYLGKSLQLGSLEETISKRWKCLLVTDQEHPEMNWFKTTYVHSLNNSFEVVTLQKFQAGKATMVGMHPASLPRIEEVVKVRKEKVTHTNEHHFAKGSTVVKVIYDKLKADALKLDKSLVFNASGGHYISMKKPAGKNLCFFHFRKTSMYLVVKVEEKIVRKAVKKAEVQSLKPSVQQFWNGASTGLVIRTVDQVKEVSALFKTLVKQ